MKLGKTLGTFLLGIWLIMSGLMQLLDLSFSGIHTLMAILAIVAGALVILGK